MGNISILEKAWGTTQRNNVGPEPEKISELKPGKKTKEFGAGCGPALVLPRSLSIKILPRWRGRL